MTLKFSPVAYSVPFDNETNGFIASDVQAAIEEARATASASRYTIACGFDGTAGVGRWHEFATNVPSDGTPFVVPKACTIREIAIASSGNSTTTISIYKNGTVTVIETIALAAQSRNYKANLNINLAAGDYLAAKTTAGSASKPMIFIFIQNQG